MPKKCTLDELQKNRKISRLTTGNFDLFRDGDYIRDVSRSIREHEDSPTLLQESNNLDKDRNSPFIDTSSFDSLKKDSLINDSGKSVSAFIDGAKNNTSKSPANLTSTNILSNQKTINRSASDINQKDSAKSDSIKKDRLKPDIAIKDGDFIDRSGFDNERRNGEDILGSVTKVSEVSGTTKFSNEKNLNIGQSQRLKDGLAKKDQLKIDKLEYYSAKTNILENQDSALIDASRVDSEKCNDEKKDTLGNISKKDQLKNDISKYYSEREDGLENVSRRNDGVKYNIQTRELHAISTNLGKDIKPKVDKDEKEKSYNRTYTESTKIFHYNSKEEANALGEKNFTFGIDTFVIDKLFARIESPAACVVYIYLWRRTIGQGQEKIKISAKVIGDVLNFNRRTIIMAIRHLNEKNLIHTEGLGQLGIHEHKILRDWV